MKNILLFILFYYLLCSTSWATIAFRNSSGTSNASSTSIVISKPTGTVSGDVLLAIIDGNNTPVITPPSGWTLVDSVNTTVTAVISIYSKVASGSEPSTYTWTLDSAQRNSGAISSFSGVNNSTSIDQEANLPDGDLDFFFTSPNVINTNANEMVVSLISFDDSLSRTWTQPSGMTLAIDTASPSGSAIAYNIQTNSGTTPSMVWTISDDGATGVAFTVSLNPIIFSHGFTRFLR